MTDQDLHPDDEDDAETAAFLRRARAAILGADPVPSDVTELAKLAFEFRDVRTVDFVDTSELAGVRSGAVAANALQATSGATTLIWTIENDRLTGIVHSSSVISVSLQTPAENTAVDLDSVNGSFEIAAPTTAYRLLVDDGDQWATPWAD